MLHPWLCRQRATHPFDDSKKPGSHGHTSHGGVRRTILGCCRYCWCVTGALVDAVFLGKPWGRSCRRGCGAGRLVSQPVKRAPLSRILQGLEAHQKRL